MTVKDHSLVAFYFKYLEGRSSFSNFAEVMKIILTDKLVWNVEHLWSMNKSLFFENLQKENFVSQHFVYDNMNVNGRSS